MFRRSLVLALLAVFGLSPAPRASQSIEELVVKNLDAKGGLARLKAVQSIKQTARLTMQGMEATMTLYSKRPNLVRQEVSLGSQLVINAFDGSTAWIINPLVGSSRPIAVSGPQADTIREQSNFDGPLVDFKARGYNVDYSGLESLGDRKVHHLRLTSPTRQVSHLYLDATTNLDVKLSTEVDTLKLEQEFSDYRAVDGITVPFRIRTLTNGVPQSEILVQAVEFNVTLDDALFRMPRG